MGRTGHDGLGNGPLRRTLPGFWGTGLLLGVSLVLVAGTTAVGQETRPATVPPPSATPARILHFPRDRSLGTVYVRDASVRREIDKILER